MKKEFTGLINTGIEILIALVKGFHFKQLGPIVWLGAISLKMNQFD